MVSVLVAAWNEGVRIEQFLQSFASLSYPNVELILCAGGTDDTLRRALNYANERVIVLEQRAGEGKQASLARCLERATGEILYLTDADSILSDEALVRALDPLVNDGEDVATGTVCPVREQRHLLLPRYLEAIETAANSRIARYRDGLQGANIALTRRALQLSGGFNFEARTGTDYLLAKRVRAAGLKIAFVRASVIPTNYPETISAYRHRQSRWLRNLVLHGWRNRAWNEVAVTVRPMLIGLVITIMPLAALATGGILLVSWVLLVAQAVCARVRYVLMAARIRQGQVPRSLFFMLLPYALIDFAVWASALIDLIIKRRRERW